MKKIFIFLILSMFLISFTSAELFQFDNHKSYDVLNKEVTITNTFGIGVDIVTAKLNTPHLYQSQIGSKVKIAQFEINPFMDYENLLESFEIIDLNNKNKTIEREIIVKYWGIENYLVNDYSCSDIINKNGSKNYNCIVVGNHTEERYNWINWDKNAYANKKVIVELYMDMFENEKFDWKPTIAGMKINEWAVVTSGAVTTTDGAYTIVTYANNGTFNVTSQNLYSNTSVLIIAGGGGGGGGNYNGAGGGAGGLIYNGTFNIPVGNYNIIVGVGGVGGIAGGNSSKGQNSSAFSLIAVGGGNAGQFDAGNNGGSGGGGSYGSGTLTNTPGGLGTAGQGNRGGNYVYATDIGGGGGGAGSTGNDTNGNGGAGLTYYINGSAVCYAGGGGGGEQANVGIATCGGGNGSTGNGFNGIDGTGGGGGGAERLQSATGGKGGNGIVIIRYLTADTSISPTLTLNSPIDYFNITTASITFNITATDTQKINNVTLYIDNVVNVTDTSNVNGTYLFNKTLSEGNHNWSVLIYNNNSQSQNATRFLTIDISIPIINITSPINGTINYTNFTKTNLITSSITWTASAFNLDKCFITNLSSGANETGTCNNMNRTYYLPFGNYTYRVYSNDTFNHFGAGYSMVDYRFRLFENTINWTTPILENTNQTYTFNFNKTSYLTISELNFIYNNVSYTSPYSSSADYQTITSYFTTPFVTTDTNYTFYWSVLYSDGTRVNSSFNTQQVNNILFGSCGTYTNQLFNFSLVDEKTQLPINGTIETNFVIKTSDGLTELYNWASSSSTGNNSLCSNYPLTLSSYNVEGIIKYFSSTENYSASTEYYNYLNYTLNNITQNLNTTLYDLNITEATDFQLTFKDSSGLSRENILIYVYRQYLPSGDFKIVELPKTDSNGQVVVHLVRNDVIYNFIAVDSAGNVLGTLNNVIAFCNDYTIGDCKINFKGTSVETQLENYINDLGLSYTLSFNSATNIVSFVFSSTTNTIKNMRLEVISTAVITNRTLCNSSLSAIAGTLTCDVSSVVNNSASIYVKIFMDNEEIIDEYLDLFNSDWNTKGILFFGFLLLLIVGIMFIESKEGLIIAVVLGFIVLVGLGIAKGKVIGFTSGILWLIIVGVILLIKLNKEKSA